MSLSQRTHYLLHCICVVQADYLSVEAYEHVFDLV